MSRIASLSTAVAAAVAIIGVVVLVLLTPAYIHIGLRQADSATWLGVSAEQAEALSDRTVSEMVFGPATFAFPIADGGARFYDEAEASHLRDARLVLYGLGLLVMMALATLGVGFVRRRRVTAFWRAVSRGAGALAVAFAVIGALFLVAFDAAFTAFHEIFFPGGNWSFDPSTEHMVQLYPSAFWQLTTTVLGALAIVIGALVWWLARRRATALGRLATP